MGIPGPCPPKSLLLPPQITVCAPKTRTVPPQARFVPRRNEQFEAKILVITLEFASKNFFFGRLCDKYRLFFNKIRKYFWKLLCYFFVFFGGLHLRISGNLDFFWMKTRICGNSRAFWDKDLFFCFGLHIRIGGNSRCTLSLVGPHSRIPLFVPPKIYFGPRVTLSWRRACQACIVFKIANVRACH